MKIIHHSDGRYDLTEIETDYDLSLILSAVITVDRFAEMYDEDTNVKKRRRVLANEIKTILQGVE